MESSGFKPKKNLGDKTRLCSLFFFLGVAFLFYFYFLMNDYNLFLPNLNKSCCLLCLTRRAEGTGLFRKQ